MMDGTGIELYVHLEKLEDEVEQFNNVSKNFGDYIDMYKRQMDVIRYSKMADGLYDMPALIRTYDEFVEEADRLNKFSKALQDIYKEYKMCNDTYTQMGIDLGNQYAITPWAKTNEGKIVIGTSISPSFTTRASTPAVCGSAATGKWGSRSRRTAPSPV